MGFTRTSEGRVFFQGVADNDDAPRMEKTAPPAEPVMNTDQTQMQILLLLKSLNTKLKSSKEDQSAMKKQLALYRESLKALKEKAATHENNYIDMEQKVARKQTEAQKQTTRVEETLKDTLKQLEEARKLVEELESKAEENETILTALKTDSELRKKEAEEIKKLAEERKAEEEKILKRQKELEKLQAAQGEKMVDSVAAYVTLTKRVSEAETRQAALDNKIEDNTSEFLKLDRKIDKTIEDRNRIMRKIERIEAAVMETRDALNAKAMVLLTQQTPSDVPAAPTSEGMIVGPHATLYNEESDLPWWKKSIHLQPVYLIIILTIVLSLGWLISTAFQSAPATPLKIDADSFSSSAAETQSLTLKADADLQSRFASNTEEPAAPVEEDNYGITIHKGAEKQEIEEKIDIRNEAQMLAMMDKDPGKVATALNEIEPVSIPEEKPKQDTAEENIKTITKIEADLPAPKQPEKLPPRDANYFANLKKKIKPDSRLTDVAKRIEDQAFAGIPEAQHDMGAIYVAGHDTIKQDLKRAILWFEEAANSGVANAKYNLGVLYHQGLGVDKSLERALELYQDAAEQGHPEAQYNLGIANIEGIGVPYNPQKAAHYFENAANGNITEAAYNLGLIYENGLLGETHPDEALMWYKTAADNGSPEAKSALEQLASSLGIAMSDVNLVAEKTRKAKQGNTPSAPPSQQYITSQIQNELMKRGLYPGPVDGMNGPMTANAIKTFQSSADLTPDGIPSQDLLSFMQSQATQASWD